MARKFIYRLKFLVSNGTEIMSPQFTLATQDKGHLPQMIQEHGQFIAECVPNGRIQKWQILDEFNTLGLSRDKYVDEITFCDFIDGRWPPAENEPI